MDDILREITKLQGVRGALLMGSDGFVIASELAEGDDENVLSAEASSIYASLHAVVARLERGALERFVLNGDEGSAVLTAVSDAILLTLVRKGANMGMILVEMKSCADTLRARLHG